MSKGKLIGIMVLAAVLAFGAVGVIVRWDSLFGGSASASGLGDKPRVSDVAGKLGCKAEISKTTRMFARESGSCDWDGQRLSIEVFESEKLRDDYLATAKNFGGNYAAGTGWLVFGDSPDVIARAAERLGGKVV